MGLDDIEEEEEVDSEEERMRNQEESKDDDQSQSQSSFEEDQWDSLVNQGLIDNKDEEAEDEENASGEDS